MKNILLITLTVLLAVLNIGCGGSGSPATPASPETQTGDQAAPIPEQGLGTTVLRNASGAPTGIRLNWEPVDDTAEGGSPIVGYHIYKAPTIINNVARGNQSLWIEIDGSTLIPQPQPPTAEPITVDDLFSAVVGEGWYYRISAVAEDGDESELSPVAFIRITEFTVTQLELMTAGVGQPVPVAGRNFGQTYESNDKVEVPGVEWQDGIGFVDVMLEAEIVEWGPDRIVFNVPTGATKGPIRITVDGESAESLDEFENSDPYINSINRLQGTILNQVVLGGANFGTGPAADWHLVFGGNQYLSGQDYSEFTADQLTINPMNTRRFQVDEFYFSYDGKETVHGRYELLNEDPVSYLMAEPDTGPEPLSVTVYPARPDGSGGREYSFDPEGGLAFYRYDFGNDGSVEYEETTPAPVREVLAPGGIHQIRLEVEDLNGATNATVIAVSVDGVPDADLAVEPQAGLAPLSVDLDASGSDDADGSIEDYEWDFDGNGVFNETANGEDSARGSATAVFVYEGYGDYNAAVRVTDNDGYQGTASQLIEAEAAPVADLQADPTAGTIPLDVSFDAMGSFDPFGSIEDFEWDFDGDGVFNESDNGEDIEQGNGSPSYQFNNYGDFTVEVRVTDDAGYTGTASVNIAANSPPTADLVANPLRGSVPFSSAFNATGSSDPDGSIDDYEWDFDGDGVFNETGTEADSRGSAVPKFSYAVAGDFNAAVRVTDDYGATDTDSVLITAISSIPLVENWDHGIAPGDTGSLWDVQGSIGTRSLDWINTTSNRLLNGGAGDSARFARFDSLDIDGAGRWYYGDNVNRAMQTGPFPVVNGLKYRLRFSLAGFSEGLDTDYLRVSYSWDGTNWTDVADGAGRIGSEWRYAGDFLPDGRWGSFEEWFDAGSDQFFMRILFISNGQIENNDGPCIDEIILEQING